MTLPKSVMSLRKFRQNGGLVRKGLLPLTILHSCCCCCCCCCRAGLITLPKSVMSLRKFQQDEGLMREGLLPLTTCAWLVCRQVSKLGD